MSRCKDQSKNPRRGVQMAPKCERAFGAQEPILHFWSAERHFKRAEFSLFGLWLNDLRVTIRHIFFDLFAKVCIWIHIVIVRAYFLDSSDLYKQRLNLIIQHLFFLCSGRHMFQALKLIIFSNPLSEFCCLNQGFQVSKTIKQISLNPKTSSQEQRVLMQEVVFITLSFSYASCL